MNDVNREFELSSFSCQAFPKALFEKLQYFGSQRMGCVQCHVPEKVKREKKWKIIAFPCQSVERYLFNEKRQKDFSRCNKNICFRPSIPFYPLLHWVYFTNQAFIVIIYSFRNIRHPLIPSPTPSPSFYKPNTCSRMTLTMWRVVVAGIKRLEHKSIKKWNFLAFFFLIIGSFYSYFQLFKYIFQAFACKTTKFKFFSSLFGSFLGCRDNS